MGFDQWIMDKRKAKEEVAKPVPVKKEPAKKEPAKPAKEVKSKGSKGIFGGKKKK